MSVRAEIIREAESWLRTPYHHAACVKGAGVDCAFFLIGVYRAVGLVDSVHIDSYPPDWHLHREEERYLNKMLEYCDLVADPLPGDIVLYRFGRCIAHGAIVVEWPSRIIHSVRNEGVIFSDPLQPAWAERFAGFYRLRGL